MKQKLKYAEICHGASIKHEPLALVRNNTAGQARKNRFSF